MSESKKSNGTFKTHIGNLVGSSQRLSRGRSASSPKAPAIDDTKLDRLERRFPRSSGKAFEAARKKTLAAGVSVLEAENGAVYRVDAGGNRALVKRIAPARSVKLGTKIKLR